MRTEKDLKLASRDTLLTIIAEQQAVITELRERIEELERRGPPRGRPVGMPGNKYTPKRPRPERTEPPKKRTQGFARRRMRPTRQVVHALDSCPECGTGMTGGWVHRTREVIEIPLAPAEVIEQVFVARMCALCRKRRLPHDSLKGVAVGRQRMGINLVSLIVTLREEGRLPIRSIQQYLRAVHHLKLSVGAIVETIRRVARQAQRTVDETLERIRGSPVVHADETGWREDGANGYVWTFSTPTDRYFVRRGRGKKVVDEVLGESFDGVLVSDFYAAYNHYPGLKQRCWVHLLRDIHELKALYPEDTGLVRWAGAVRQLYDRAKTYAEAGGQPAPGYQRMVSHGQLMLEKQLLALCRPFSNDDAAPQAKLCRRIERFIKELFVFVSHPDVPSENNAAERSLRHLVISRKISGGTRSEQGTNSKMTLASLLGTWRAKGLNPLSESRNLLVSHQLLYLSSGS
ncbi:MAG: IS66 family transposase [Aphanocapsa feldmannii 277cV]|uniref:IS66 family transposase n=1 Tax=Aphanocapsa feldmannii 277cV TaxID=2507553 RepID=A0A524RR08_9CHRO|nr:MAG: IS66 family transposase [Aphanocapsa feldmannii 277cV]